MNVLVHRVISVAIVGTLVAALLYPAYEELKNGPASNTTVEVGSNKSAENWVVKRIGLAKTSIEYLAEDLPSKTVVEALATASREQDVKVRMVLDSVKTQNKQKSLEALSKAGISVRTETDHRLPLDGYMVLDEVHTMTGTLSVPNGVDSKTHYVLSVFNDKVIARNFLTHWNHHWGHSKAFRP